uniref:Bifunctional arginine demethylase and lysyl-hydroxylase JMJD6 n=1 Tax=Ascaris suum TaxID=6253 RepID=F1L8G1_ASCSU
MKESRVRKRIAHAKRKARPELKSHEWDQLHYSKTLLSSIDLFNGDNIERIDGSHLNADEFIKLYETRHIPIILTGITDNWRANTKWTLNELSKKYRNQKFKCGEDDDGYSVKLKMKYYMSYMRSTNDDSPLYIFDSSFGERHKTRRLLDDYEVPVMFQDDLFRYANEKRRPPYRWIVIGPARSGTGVHVDPLGTSAWNALINGHKKWCFLHPETPKSLLKPRKEECGKHPDEATTWFLSVYRRVKAPDWPKSFPPIEAIQRPGELVFVPSGWWHVVLNLSDTVAVTQNFCSITNLPAVWRKTIRKRPNFAKHWLRALRLRRPEVLAVIEQAAKEGSDLNLESSDDSSSSSSSSSYSSDSEWSIPDSVYGAGDSIALHRCRKRKRRAETNGENDDHSVRSKSINDECAAKSRRSPN